MHTHTLDAEPVASDRRAASHLGRARPAAFRRRPAAVGCWPQVLVLAALAVRQCLAWPDGAPCFDGVLQNMYPAGHAHQGGERPDRVPYKIELSSTCYQPQTDVKLTLRGVSREWRFRGFMLQARDPGSTSGFGEFVRDDNGSWKYQCFGVKHAITHSHNEPKYALNAYWQFNRRQRATGNVQFIATVVANKQNYWVQQVRSIILVPCRQGNDTSRFGPFDVTYPEPQKPTTLPPLRVHTSRLVARASGQRFGRAGAPPKRGFTHFRPPVDLDFAAAQANFNQAEQHEIRRVDETDLPPAETEVDVPQLQPQFDRQSVQTGFSVDDNDCRDRLPECQSWLPFCASDTYVDFLREHCARSCNLCTPLG